MQPLSLALLLAAAPALTLAPAGAHTTETRPSERDAAGVRAGAPAPAAACDSHAWPSLGSRTAPVTVQLFADPTQRYALQMWLEARTLLAERPGEVRVELIPSPSEPSADLSARQRSLHRWFHAVAELGASERALRAVDLHGEALLQDRLATPARRRALAVELGLDPDAVERELAGTRLRCIDARIDAASFELRRASARVMGRSRPPLVALVRPDLPRVVYADGERLPELRGRIGDLLQRRATPELARIPPIPGSGDPLAFDRTFDDTGILLGGLGLPHRLLILADGENDPRVYGVLAPALAFAADHPGILSVQVVAADSSPASVELRQRLCAARSRGLEREYLGYLAHPPERRNVITATLGLTKELDDPRAGKACADAEPSPDALAESSAAPASAPASERRTPMPHGAWIDGRPVGPGEMETLELRFWGPQGPGVLDWWWHPDGDDE